MNRCKPPLFFEPYTCRYGRIKRITSQLQNRLDSNLPVNKKHWLFPKNRPLTELEAWITILIEVNHENEKFRIGYEFFDCKRGEKFYSLETWAKLFNWNKSKVRRFLSLLQKDSMIELKSVQNTPKLMRATTMD